MYKATSSLSPVKKWSKLNKTTYRGRFAPSPTGDLHLGSLVAAIASYCQAKSNDGQWLIRIEDIDETRTVDGADRAIIDTLSKFGMRSDEEIIYQTDSKRQHAYQNALNELQNKNLTYPCICTRKQLKDLNIYPGNCINKQPDTNHPFSIRLKTTDHNFEFQDLIQGRQIQNIQKQSGDFNIKRKDGLFCYQLVVVMDDAAQGITEVVRGIDIMDSTFRQMHLIELLDLPQPGYAHFPVVTTKQQKLSKQNHAKPITNEDTYSVTLLALDLLQQKTPILKQKTQSALLNWAVENWQPEKLQGLTEVNYSVATP